MCFQTLLLKSCDSGKAKQRAPVGAPLPKVLRRRSGAKLWRPPWGETYDFNKPHYNSYVFNVICYRYLTLRLERRPPNSPSCSVQVNNHKRELTIHYKRSEFFLNNNTIQIWKSKGIHKSGYELLHLWYKKSKRAQSE